MSNIGFHPAPGLGDLINGWFIVPQNPIRDASQATVIVPSVQATAPGQILRKPTLAEYLPATFRVPQNPLAKQLGMAGCAGCGMGDLSVSGFTDWAQQTSPIASLPNWVVYGAGAVAAWLLLMPGGSEYRAARSEHRGYRRLARKYANPRRRRR